jgi:hypothetical protein
MARSSLRPPNAALPDAAAGADISSRRSGLLADHAVAVWWLATDAVGPADLGRSLAIPGEDERERAARSHFAADRREFIAAHTLLRSILAHFLDLPAVAWRFTATPGKPTGRSPRPISRRARWISCG